MEEFALLQHLALNAPLVGGSPLLPRVLRSGRCKKLQANWYIMQHLPGMTLKKWLAVTAPMPSGNAPQVATATDSIDLLPAFIRLLRSLQQLDHPHGDVKPGNLLLFKHCVEGEEQFDFRLIDPVPTIS